MSGGGQVSDTHWALGGTTVYPPFTDKIRKAIFEILSKAESPKSVGWWMVLGYDISKPAFVKVNEERYWQKEKVAMAWLTVRD